MGERRPLRSVRPARRLPPPRTLLFVALGIWRGAESPALAAEVDAGYRAHELTVAAGGHPGFTLLAPDRTGVDFTNVLSDRNAAENQIRLNGSGVALGDVDGDGWCDLFVCALEGRVALYRNLGQWRFTNLTATAGLDFPGNFSTGATFADVDGDGDLDLLVNGIGTGTRLFRNDGHGHFTEAVDAGLVRRYGATTSALADIDGDGFLDLYVANYRTNTVRSTGFNLLNVGGRRMIPPAERGHLELTPEGRVLEHGEPHLLYRNDGQGLFHPVSWTDGTFLDEDGRPLAEAPRDWGLSCVFRDLNGDGAPDLYVCNDFHSPDRLWLNDGHGRFRAIPRLALRHTATFSMAADFADVDRDGRDDILVSDMTSRQHGRRLMQIAGMDPHSIRIGVFDDRPQLDRTVLQWNRGDGTYAEIAHYAGLEDSEWNWSVLFLDVDLDGFEDVLAATGHRFDTQDLDAQARIQAAGPYPRSRLPEKLLKLPPLAQAKLAFRNGGDLTFTECGQAWGFDQVGVAQGMALADLDHDGDLDVVVNNLNGALGIYRNDASAPRLAVRLKGRPPNTAGIGARIVVTGGPVTQSQEMMCGGRYLSCDETLRVFAAGSLDRRLRIEVTWRSGQRSVVREAKPNHIYEIDETGAVPSTNVQRSTLNVQRSTINHQPPTINHQPSTINHQPSTTNHQPSTTNHQPSTTNHQPSTINHQPSTINHQPLFEDASELLKHSHHEDPFDDFGRQPLLPRRLSQLGPGVCWCDVDGDGWEDLLIGSGKGGQPGVFRNDAHGKFHRLDEPPWNLAVTRDQTSVLAWTAEGGTPAVLVGSANYEDGLAVGGAVRQYTAGEPQVADAVPATGSSAGPLALADYDEDGQLDLFVGGRSVPGRYPEPAQSQLWRRDGGRWVLDAENTAKLATVGMVSGAIWTDLDGDGWPELVLACEWGPVRIFRNEHGRLTPWDAPLTWAAPGPSDAGPADVQRSTLNSQLPTINHQASTINQLTGWWNGVTAGDFDGDGNLDILVTNWGLNTEYRATPEAPYRLYYGDFDGTGAVHLLEATFNGTAEVPERDLATLASALPALRERFPTYESYGRATVADVLGPALASARRLEVNTLVSIFLLNRANHFVVVPLPREAQFAPAFAACVADFDGDGREDVFLSQNFFATHVRFPRCDAGRGLWLQGDGQGGFRAVPGQESGIQVYGEQRGAAVGDFDRDGRTDLVVTQNGGETRLYRNRAARPGLRVRLNAGPRNPTGIGATIRLRFGPRLGPAREIHAGSGYWSQDSAVQVLADPEPPTGYWVRWPGGRTSAGDVPAGAREIAVDLAGNVTRLP